MEMTAVFNEAAQGGGGEAQTIHGPQSGRPSGGAEARAETGSEKGVAASEEREGAIAHLAREFNGAVGEAESEARSERPDESAEDQRLTVDSAEVELEGLEAGRPTPEPRAELKPPPHLVRIVNTETERRREARISALKAYLEFRRSGPGQSLGEEHRNSPELAL